MNNMYSTPVPTSQPWFAVRLATPGIFIVEEPHHAEQVKSYLIEGEERAILLDTGMGVGDMRALVAELTVRPVVVVNSHAHWDHIGGNRQFDEIWIHEAEADALLTGVPNTKLRRAFASEHLTGPLPEGIDPVTISFPPTPATGTVRDGHRFDLGGRTLEVIHGPGHSPGGISLLDAGNRVLFSTDVAYAGALYVYDPAHLPMYLSSLSRLADLAPELEAVCPAHGPSPISPAMLPTMRDGIAAVIDGMPPQRTEGDMARYDFDGFALQVWGMPTGC
ncbi:MAG: MBL fold metallo-hydrolase [Chloroflexia bacterium]|nr:MBL fold metallo-hydrolase [Chloroflexia bacterium]